jgi:hypothetical protein
VDGAEDNRPLFEHNTAGRTGLQFHLSLLAGHEGEIRGLVRHHGGSAMASGTGLSPAQTLDQLLGRTAAGDRWDVLKIDVDGYDGEVLRGARSVLETDQPAVIFEWHPLLIQACGQDPAAAFEALRGAGYETLLWFSNKGVLSHRSDLPTSDVISWWRKLLLARSPGSGAHFDVVAIPVRWRDLADAVAERAVFPG